MHRTDPRAGVKREIDPPSEPTQSTLILVGRLSVLNRGGRALPLSKWGISVKNAGLVLAQPASPAHAASPNG